MGTELNEAGLGMGMGRVGLGIGVGLGMGLDCSGLETELDERGFRGGLD